MQEILSAKLVSLVIRVVYKTPEIEYIHYALQIVNHALQVKELRRVICSEDLRSASEITDNIEDAVVYHVFLRNTVEKQSEIMSIDKLYKKVVRQRKEIEKWAAALKKSQAPSTSTKIWRKTLKID